MKSIYIIGSGPAGISAALYLQRSGKTDVNVIASGTGALQYAEKIENYYGFSGPISGAELHKRGVLGAERLGVKFIEEEVVSLGFGNDMRLQLSTNKNNYEANAVLIATGAARKSLPIVGLKEHEGKGVSYCAVCDAFFYRGKDVCVIGSGEYAVHEAKVLASVASSVTILTNGAEPDPAIDDTIRIITDKISSINGEGSVEKVVFEDGNELSVKGVFVAVGIAGSGDLARKIGAETENGRIRVNEKMETNVPGLFAAGDCTGGTLQIYKAVYEGATAAFSIINYLKNQS